MNKSNVLITVTNDVVFDRRISRITETLMEAGYQVHRIGRTLPRTPNSVSLHEDITLLKCPFRQGPLFYFWFNVMLYRFARRMDYRIHVSVDSDTLLAGLLLTRKPGRVLVFDSHEWFERTPELVHSPLKRKIWRFLSRLGTQKASLCMTVSHSLAAALHDEYGTPFRVIRNLPLRSQDMGVGTQTAQTIIYLGVLNAGRGLELAIEALLQLPGYRLKLIGEGDLSTALRRQVAEMGLLDRVIFCGHLPPESIYSELKGGSWGLLMLDPVSESYRLSLANKFFDYVQADLPVLCSALPEYQRLMDEHQVGRLIKDYSVEALVSVIREVDQDPNEYDRMVAACQHAAAVWIWEKEATKLIRLFNQMDHPE